MSFDSIRGMHLKKFLPFLGFFSPSYLQIESELNVLFFFSKKLMLSATGTLDITSVGHNYLNGNYFPYFLFLVNLAS